MREGRGERGREGREGKGERGERGQRGREGREGGDERGWSDEWEKIIIEKDERGEGGDS